MSRKWLHKLTHAHVTLTFVIDEFCLLIHGWRRNMEQQNSFNLTKLKYHSCWYTDQVAVTKNITDITYGVFTVKKKAKRNIQIRWFIHLCYKLSIGIKRTNIKLSLLLHIRVSASSCHSKLYDVNLFYVLLLSLVFSRFLFVIFFPSFVVVLFFQSDRLF
jgi:hypothetical protein